MERKALVVGGAGGPEEQLIAVLQRFGFGPPASVASVPEATARLRDEHIDLLLVPLQAIDAVDLAMLEREMRRATSTFVIGTAPEANPDLILRAMRAGIHEFVQYPPDARDLASAVDRLMQRRQVASSEGLKVAVYSAKGGLGTTSTAVNLAYGFAANNPSARVALVDFVVTGGDVGVLLDLRPAYDVSDLALKASRMDRELLHSMLTAAPGGVWVLPAGDKPEVSDLVDASAATVILAQLAASSAFVVIDCEHYLTDRTLAALDTADRVVLVTQLNIAALRSAQRTVQLCRRLGYPDEKVAVVVNRWQSADVVSTDDAARLLEREVLFKIPNDYRTLAGALTRGQAVNQYDPSSPLTASYAALAAKLGGSSPTANGDGKSNSSRLGRLLGRGRR